MEISSDKVAQVILLSREGSRGEDELYDFIEAMNEDEQAHLTAIMWIGREAYDVEDYDKAVAKAFAEKTTPTVDYLTGVPHLAEHLENGLDALGVDVSDVENDLM
ncbi:DUF3775 domain-containing protein [Nereida sp. MMG025]|uniref:DUF3775 domain-containing protein n=1 Tax=Nereida sp. MMG025 TaxID=2909981 RepID=UPI001F1E0865|nr:DUF3775 domain-containing protein [Nereida sp. MMG025]MCF6444862.1 DUF3775 domain-containing protein [Nereida sp. MMG025]